MKVSIPPPIPIGSLTITSGIRVTSATNLPAGFEADPDYAPIWLQGPEIAIAGNAAGKSVVLGVGGAGGSSQRIIAEDFGVSAPRGKILDIAASPDGLTVATAVADPKENQLEVILRDTLSDNTARPAASFDGAFTWTQLKWLDQTTLALATRSASTADDSSAAASNLKLITAAGPLAIRPLDQIKCALSPLSFSPNSQLAVAQGDTNAPPLLIDLHAETCSLLTIREPVRVLSWAPDASAFLYFAQSKKGAPAAFRYDLRSGLSTVVAVSSCAAAYASDGTIVAAGNDELSWRRASDAPNKPIEVQIALISPGRNVTYVNALGFRTAPAMLARTSMIFSQATDTGVMDVTIPVAAGPQRELIEYSYPSKSAFLLASGPAGAPLTLSWSPDGMSLALVDAGAQPNRLTVLAPPR